MKKYISLLAAVLCALTFMFTSCQKGEPIDYQPTGTTQLVDLGLPSGTLWAKDNIGATASNIAGRTFAWGETSSSKSKYDWSTYKYWDVFNQGVTKYCFSSQMGKKDEIPFLQPEDDVATRVYGSNYRIPTPEEWQELVDNCVWELKEVDGVNVYEITNPDFSSEKLTLPQLNYWSNHVNTINSHYAWRLQTTDYIGYHSGDHVQVNSGYRYLPYYVRAVSPKK